MGVGGIRARARARDSIRARARARDSIRARARARDSIRARARVATLRPKRSAAKEGSVLSHSSSTLATHLGGLTRRTSA